MGFYATFAAMFGTLFVAFCLWALLSEGTLFIRVPGASLALGGTEPIVHAVGSERLDRILERFLDAGASNVLHVTTRSEGREGLSLWRDEDLVAIRFGVVARDEHAIEEFADSLADWGLPDADEVRSLSAPDPLSVSRSLTYLLPHDLAEIRVLIPRLLRELEGGRARSFRVWVVGSAPPAPAKGGIAYQLRFDWLAEIK